MKQAIYVVAPIGTRSGYGQHSRLIVKSLLTMQDKYDIKIIPTRWGNTPQTAMPVEFKPFLHFGAIPTQPDIFIVISIPSEMQRLGKFNILITAGTESSVCSPDFIEGCNKADLVIVPSEFTKKVLLETNIEKKDRNTGQTIGTVKVTKPIVTLFEGVDTNVFKKGSTTQFDLSEVKEDFAFLCVSGWLQGAMGEDRKNVSGLVHLFYDVFKRKGGTNRPALILKTNGAGFSEVEKFDILNKIKMISENHSGILPSVYVLNGDLSDTEMNDFYNHPKVKAMISLTHAEGYGLPLSEFTLTGKPVIASGYSGQLDFLSKDHGSVLLPGQMTKIHDSAANEWIVRGSEWFTPNYAFAGQIMNDVYENYDKYQEKSRKHPKYTKDNFSLEKMTELFGKILDENVPSKPAPIRLSLPKLNKIE